MSDSLVLTVSELNRYVKSILDGDRNLNSVFVKGEISNFKAQFSSGHYYMTIKDEKAQIRAVMFKFSNQRLKFIPENNMSVIIRGRVTLYEQGGEYQLIIDDMQPDGTGALALAFEQLKKKLEAKGMFDSSHKKQIPEFPQRVGIATSGSGAAIKDLINVIGRRFPACEIVFCPVSVQGDGAAKEIADAVKLFNEKNAADVIIIGRGGGSIEDLWAFNEEILAEAVYDSKIPVISAVGHETDFTICDFVADLRAPTPSAAAELAVPDCCELLDSINSVKRNMLSGISAKLSNCSSKLDYCLLSLEKNSPTGYIENLSLRCDSAASSMNASAKMFITARKAELDAVISKIDSFSPMKTLSRGYSVVTKDGKIVSDATSLNAEDKIDIRMINGTVKCEVI